MTEFNRDYAVAERRWKLFVKFNEDFDRNGIEHFAKLEQKN